jgi:peptide/nickel transport system permease protein
MDKSFLLLFFKKEALAFVLLVRFLSAVATLLGALVLLFGLTLFVPGNPAQVLLGPRATPAAIAAYTHMMGLDQPVAVRFGLFVWRALQGDLGVDVVSGRSVLSLVVEVLPFTLVLTGSAIGFALLVGIPLGLASAGRPGGVADRVIALSSLSFMAMPNFVLAILLLLVFSRVLGWAPVLGTGPEGGMSVGRLVLPAVTLAAGWIGYIARLLRASLLEAMRAPYIRTARAYGLGERRILVGHALRVAVIPLVAVLGVGVGQLLGGAVFVEIIFGRPGIGTLLFHAIGDRDYPVVQTGVLVVVALFVGTNLLVDLLLLRLDPRMRAA